MQVSRVGGRCIESRVMSHSGIMLYSILLNSKIKIHLFIGQLVPRYFGLRIFHRINRIASHYYYFVLFVVLKNSQKPQH